MVGILTQREKEVISKKLSGARLTQQDSNYLSRYVRPKLREMSLIDSKTLLKKLEYNREKKYNEERIKRLILDKVKDVEVIILYGSVVYNDWRDYEDIDIIVGVKKKSWKKLREKWKLILDVRDTAKKKGLNLDVKIFLKKDIIESYSSNLALIYQLKDRKVIYGDLKLPEKIEIPKLGIRMHLDYSFLADKESSAKELYSMIRNAWLAKLIISKIVDNLKLNEIPKQELGENLINKLKLNKASANERKIALIYVNELAKKIWKEVMEAKWEKVVL